MGRWGLVFLICVFAGQSAHAEDMPLKSLSQKLAGVRGTHVAANHYGAGPALTPIKRLIRQWVERAFPSLGPHGDTGRLTKQLNRALAAARLTCDQAPTQCVVSDPPNEFDARGYLNDVQLSTLNGRYLLVETSVGIICGYDESAYVYEWRGGQWRLLLQSEQDRYDDKIYRPQNFITVAASPGHDVRNVSAPPLILTIGFSPWCQSNWQLLYTRLWHASSSTPSPCPLIDRNDSLFLEDDEARARLSDNDVLIAFDGESIDGGVNVRTHVLHYAIDGNRLRRIAPVAADPRSFVDEWLSQPFSESAQWIDAPARAAGLSKWYAAFHGGGKSVFGDFDDAPLRCRGDRSLWQIGFTKEPGPSSTELTGYFIVRWLPPYRFTLVDIRKDKSRDCDVAAPIHDSADSLFPAR